MTMICSAFLIVAMRWVTMKMVLALVLVLSALRRAASVLKSRAEKLSSKI